MYSFSLLPFLLPAWEVDIMLFMEQPSYNHASTRKGRVRELSIILNESRGF